MDNNSKLVSGTMTFKKRDLEVVKWVGQLREKWNPQSVGMDLAKHLKKSRKDMFINTRRDLKD